MHHADPEAIRGGIAHLIHQASRHPISQAAALALVDAMADDPDHWAWARIGTARMRQAFADLTAARLHAAGAQTRQAQRAAQQATAHRPATPGKVA